MSDLRVPTLVVPADVVCSDGRQMTGSLFVPAASSKHEGPMRAEEWLNSGDEFFPFLPSEGGGPVILNKGEVLSVSVENAGYPAPEEQVDVDRRVVVECGGRAFEGHLHIDMPSHHSRVLDYLNRPDRFLAIHDGLQVHLVRKRSIVRVIEAPEG